MENRDGILQLDDFLLVKQCDLEFTKGTGNGGQKRNKTSSAVRLRHRESGLTAEDCSERSQHRNRANALQKLRMLIALNVRNSPPQPLPRLECALDSPDYPLWAARLLDLLAENGGDHRPCAVVLACSATSLAKKITRDPRLLQAVNLLRQQNGIPPLR
ncbi:MAG: peptide chain release factor-like protein [Lentisphaeria bacterium]|nr:peptide chain release factor-like protein [Lentisphaeria bacterium]MBQ8755481.1 peptide chain release factor-like protein [Lentisphaeria bacterium]